VQDILHGKYEDAALDISLAKPDKPSAPYPSIGVCVICPKCGAPSTSFCGCKVRSDWASQVPVPK